MNLTWTVRFRLDDRIDRPGTCLSAIIGVFAFGDPFQLQDVIGMVLVLVAITILDPPRSWSKEIEEVFDR